MFRRTQHIIAVAFAALAAMVLIIAVLPGKLSVLADSTQYLTVASSLRIGRGFTTMWWAGHYEPLSHYPPMYPLAIAGMSYLTGDIERSALVLNLIFAPISIILMAYLAKEMVKGTSEQSSREAMGFGAVAGCLMCPLTIFAATALTEEMFVVLMLGMFLAVAKWINSGGESKWLFFASVLAGVAMLTRYIGIVLVGCLCLYTLLFMKKSWKNRFISAIMVGLIGIFPTLLWMVRNLLVAGSTSNRSLALHPITFSALKMGVRTGTSWLAPEVLPRDMKYGMLVVFAIVGLAVFLRIVSLSRTSRDRAKIFSGPLAALGIFIVAYVSFLVFSISLFDRATDLDERILLPVQVATVLFVTAFVIRWIEFKIAVHNRRVARRYVAAFVAVYVFSQTVGLYVWFRSTHDEGLGMASIERKSPEFVHAVANLPQGAYLYSNHPSAAYYLTGRITQGILEKYSVTSELPNKFLDADLADLRRRSRTKETYLSLFSGVDDKAHFMSVAELQRIVRFQTVGVYPGGVILRVLPR